MSQACLRGQHSKTQLNFSQSCAGPHTFSSMVPVVTNLYTKTFFFWPSRQTRPAACLSVAGFQSAKGGEEVAT